MYTSHTVIFTLSLHDALPIYASTPHDGLAEGPLDWAIGTDHELTKTAGRADSDHGPCVLAQTHPPRDRKSTRLNSSHTVISYAVFCLKKKIMTTPLSVHSIYF